MKIELCPFCGTVMVAVSPTHAFHPTGTRTCFLDSLTFEINAWNNRPLEEVIRAEDAKRLKPYCINCGKLIEEDEPYIETEHGYFKHKKMCKNK